MDCFPEPAQPAEPESHALELRLELESDAPKDGMPAFTLQSSRTRGRPRPSCRPRRVLPERT